jgi:hypothetical protein
MVRYSRYGLTPGELSGSGPRNSPTPDTLFAAYSFGVAASRAFRMTLEQHLRRSESLREVRVTDGHVPVGKSWPAEIRRRLKEARLVVADLTLLSPEVLFECGFAWGLSRPILPVTRLSPNVDRLPRWLTDLQVGDTSTAAGWMHLVDSVSSHLRETKGSRKLRGLPPAVPGRLVVLPYLPIDTPAVEQVQHIARRYGLSVDVIDTLPEVLAVTEPSVIHRVAQASLLVAGLHHAPSDSFVHFAAGVVVSHPKAGASDRLLNRRVLLVVTSAAAIRELAADSALKVEQTVRAAAWVEMADEVALYGRAYQRWERGQEELELA